jgi:hypothetical protein
MSPFMVSQRIAVSSFALLGQALARLLDELNLLDSTGARQLLALFN